MVTAPRAQHAWFCPFVALAFALSSGWASDAVAQALAPTLEDLFSLRELGGHRQGLSLSPDGSRIAVFRRTTRLASDDYQYDLLVIPARAHAEPILVGDGGGIILHATDGRSSGSPRDRVALWSPDSRWLAYLARRGDAVELWRSSADGRVREAVTQGSGDVARFAWLPSGDGLVFETETPRTRLAQATEQEERLGYRVDDRFEPYFSLRPIPDVSAGRATLVAAFDGASPRPASAAEAELLTSPNAERPPRAIDASTNHAGARAWIASIDPTTEAYRPPLGLFAGHGEDGSQIMCARAECRGRLTRLWWSADGEKIYFQRAEGFAEADTALYAWRPAGNSVRLIRRARDLLIDCAVVDDRAVCLEEDTRQPRRVVLIDMRNGRLSEIHDPSPQWRSFRTTSVERLDVQDASGNESFAHLIYPAGYIAGRRYPMVIVQYRSRGFLRAGTGGEYPIQVLAAHGYFVLSVDRPEPRALYARLSAEAVERQTEFDRSEQEMKQSALEALIAIVTERGLVDPGRIGITGMSDGAETLYWGLTRSRAFAVAVASSPPPDPLAWTLGSERFRRGMREGAGASGPWADATEPWASWWAANSTMLHAEHISAPLLMNLPESEALMAFPLYARLRELNRPVEAYVYPGEYHSKWRPQHILAAQRRALDWLDFWLQGIERPDPGDPDRLPRWRAMRERAVAVARP